MTRFTNMQYLKNILKALLILFGSVSVAYGATILTTNSSDTLSTFRTNVNTSLSNLNSGLMTAGQVGTSSVPTQGQLAYWTGAGTPSTLGSVATSSVTCSGLLFCTGFNALISSPQSLSMLVVKGNFVVGSDSGLGQATSTIFISSTGLFGHATGTPFGLVSINPAATLNNNPAFIVGSSTGTSFGVGAMGNIVLGEDRPATSTTITLNWTTTRQQVLYQIGFSATTISVINATTSQQAGSTKRVMVCNPGGTAGALTWQGVEWPSGVAPTQTTTANVCDIWTLLSSYATSTSVQKVFGFQSANLQ